MLINLLHAFLRGLICMKVYDFELIFIFTSSDSGVKVDITPHITLVLDTPPHNHISLNCSGEMLTNVPESKVFTWKKLANNTYHEITHNGDSVIITNINLEEVLSNSVLETTENVAGNYTYICSVATEHEVQSLSTLVRVKGQ